MVSAPDLLAAIRAGLRSANPDLPPAERLAPVDEMHVGGKAATGLVIDALGLSAGSRHLDIGCGLGGPARRIAATTGAWVEGIDMDAALIAAGEALNRLSGAGNLRLSRGDALHLPFAAAGFDSASLLHVGMTIADKAALMRGVGQVLRPGGRFVIYDVMRTGAGEIAHPVPWASDAVQTHLATPEAYVAALQTAGFSVIRHDALRDLAIKGLAFAQKQAASQPPLGLHLVLGADTAARMANLAAAVAAGVVTPVLMVAIRP